MIPCIRIRKYKKLHKMTVDFLDCVLSKELSERLGYLFDEYEIEAEQIVSTPEFVKRYCPRTRLPVGGMLYWVYVNSDKAKQAKQQVAKIVKEAVKAQQIVWCFANNRIIDAGERKNTKTFLER